jgi:type I phosphodiesterase/nucleotide pyrophosphatase
VSHGRRTLIVLSLSAALVTAACTSEPAPSDHGGGGPDGTSGGPVSEPLPGALAKAACSLPHVQLLRIVRGTYPSRSGQIIIVPQEPNFVGSNFPHSGPWDYLQDVPLLFYGPGVIPAIGSVDRPVTIASIAPTEAKLLHFDGFHPADGRPLGEVPASSSPPPLIVTLVWDAGGRSVLDTWPKEWPYLRSLIPKGVWFENASVGSSPSITPATHATIGTGDYPDRTGQVDAEFRQGDSLVRAGALGPALMMEPTLADLYDRAMGNAPVVGDLASVTWHLNMMGHGAMWGGGDKDIAVLRTPVATGNGNEGAEGTTWNLQGKNADFFTFPSYVNDLPDLSAYTPALDRADGKVDGKWGQDSIAQLEDGWATPARVPYQTRMVEEVIRREGFGQDDVPDLLFINYKIIDHISHLYSVNSPEMRDTLQAQDAGLKELVAALNREVGQGRWAMVMTADHGAQFDPNVSGAFQVTPGQLESDLAQAFPSDTDTPVVKAVRTSMIYINEASMKANGYTLDEISQFVLSYTKAQGASNPDLVPPADRADPVFAAAFPASILPDLKCMSEGHA